LASSNESIKTTRSCALSVKIFVLDQWTSFSLTVVAPDLEFLTA
jgi:hypothetical protein